MVIKWSHVSIDSLCQALNNGASNHSQLHCFRLNTITYSVRSHVSQFCFNVCTQVEAGSTNGIKQVVWDDVTKRFLFHKAAISTNSVNSFKHQNFKYVINN